MQQLGGCQCRYQPEAHIQCEEFAEVFCKGRYAESRHGALRILGRHIPNDLGESWRWMEQQEAAHQYLENSHTSS